MIACASSRSRQSFIHCARLSHGELRRSFARSLADGVAANEVYLSPQRHMQARQRKARESSTDDGGGAQAATDGSRVRLAAARLRRAGRAVVARHRASGVGVGAERARSARSPARASGVLLRLARSAGHSADRVVAVRARRAGSALRGTVGRGVVADRARGAAGLTLLRSVGSYRRSRILIIITQHGSAAWRRSARVSLQVATYRGRREGTKQRRGSGCTSQRGKGCTTRHRHPSRGQAGRGEQRRSLHERGGEHEARNKEGRIDGLWCARTAVGVVAGGSDDARSLAGALSVGAVGALGARRQAKVTASSACGAPERKSSRAHGSNNTESRTTTQLTLHSHTNPPPLSPTRCFLYERQYELEHNLPPPPRTQNERHHRHQQHRHHLRTSIARNARGRAVHRRVRARVARAARSHAVRRELARRASVRLGESHSDEREESDHLQHGGRGEEEGRARAMR